MWLIEKLLPPEHATPKEIARHRMMLSLTVICIVFGCSFAASPKGFAWAGDVDMKISTAIRPIAAEQKAQGDKLDKVTRLLTEQLAATVAAQIRLTISKRCKTQGFAEREELNREKDRLQMQYMEYKNQWYTEPTCGDL